MTINTNKVTKVSLNELLNSPVIVKLTSGRVISGTLKEADDIYTIKLGVKHIVLDLENVSKVSAQF